MSKKSPVIFNPNAVFTSEEKSFIEDNRSNEVPHLLSGNSSTIEKPKRRARARNISMFDDFYDDLLSFLKEFPNEGNKSSFIVRVVGEYMEKKRYEKRR
jgi:hypothetical protein